MSIQSLADYASGDETDSYSTFMSENPDCLNINPQAELRHEVVVIFSCFILGFVALRVLKYPARYAKQAPVAEAKVNRTLPDRFHGLLRQFETLLKSQQAVSSHFFADPSASAAGNEAVAVEGLAGLPHEITAEVARCLPLRDFASLSAASSSTWQRFGLSAEAWHLLAADHQVELYRSIETPEKSSEGAALGWKLREAFRRSLFHIDGQRLFHLGSAVPGLGGVGHSAVLSEAAHVVYGLMPRDGMEAVELTCLAAERALQAHNPANKDAATAAIGFLQVMRQRHETFNVAQAERLEGAYSSALQLQTLMDVAMDESFDDMEIPSDRSEASAPNTPPSTSPMLPIVGPGVDLEALDDMHEVQRHCELDALLEKLRLQTEPTST